MVFSLMLWAPSWGGMINGLLTLRGAWDRVRTEPILKFFATGITFYGMATFEGPLKTQDGWQDKLGIREFLSRAPIFFSMGSEMLQEYDRQVTLFSGACRRLNRPGLMVSAAIRGKGSVNVNDDFRVIESAPYAELFTQVSAIVTHGGIGTVARALGSGKPVFVAPMAFDQFDNGYHVKRLGVGDTKPYRSLTPQNLAKKLERLLDSAEIQSRCRAVQSQMKAADGLDQTCAYIESHLLGVSRA
jgi:UDP:flavonoid glycosyltransferase YjiC (YdhE family)